MTKTKKSETVSIELPRNLYLDLHYATRTSTLKHRTVVGFIQFLYDNYQESLHKLETEIADERENDSD